MPRPKKKIHYLYKTTCGITGKYYIGMHSTNNIDDGYLGSGKKLRHSIRKYGKENHQKEILEFFETRELLAEAEKKIITFDLLNDKLCLNLAEGGYGGNGAKFLTKEQLSKGRKKCDEILKEKYGGNFKSVIARNYYNKSTDEEKERHSQKIKEGLKNSNFNHATRLGSKQSNEFKKMISEVNSIRQKGSGNSQYGTCWVMNENESKKIKKEDLDGHLKKGWVLGRKIK